jgi:Flp pilus assembly protein TadG
MTMKTYSQKQNKAGYRAQALIEFAIVLPVLLALLVGIMEVGRMVFIYALVTNASRDAARYASVTGMGDNGNVKYNDCSMIQAIAKPPLLRAIANVNYFSITYTGATTQSCSASTTVTTGDKVTVEVWAQYTPIVKLIPFKPTTFKSKSTRTIVGIVRLK